MRLLYVISSLKRSGPGLQMVSLLRHVPGERHVVALSGPEGGLGSDATGVLNPARAGAKSETTPSDRDASRVSYDASADLGPEGGLESLLPELEAAGVQVHYLPLGYRVFLSDGAREFRALVRRIGPDVVHSSGIRADWLAAGISESTRGASGNDLHIPTVSTIHNRPYEDYRFTYGRMLAPLLVAVHATAWRRITRCVGVSQAVVDQVVGRHPGIRARAIWNGLDMKRYAGQVSPTEQASVSQRASESTGSVWLYSGHLSPLKDPLTVIRAFQQFCEGRREEKHRLVMLGDGPLRRACEKQIGSDPHIQLMGRVSDPWPWYMSARYLISASHTEGFSLAHLEGLAAGLIPIVSDIAVRRELTPSGYPLRLMFPPGDAVRLRQCMEAALHTDKEEHAALVVDIHQRFDERRMAKAYIEVYRELSAAFPN